MSSKLKETVKKNGEKSRTRCEFKRKHKEIRRKLFPTLFQNANFVAKIRNIKGEGNSTQNRPLHAWIQWKMVNKREGQHRVSSGTSSSTFFTGKNRVFYTTGNRRNCESPSFDSVTVSPRPRPLPLLSPFFRNDYTGGRKAVTSRSKVSKTFLEFDRSRGLGVQFIPHSTIP